jgi:transcriptional regulator with XRE-family HTH domain
MIDLISMGEAVAQRRHALKLTQAGLARRAKVSRATLEAFENGRVRELGVAKLLRILANLSLDLRIIDAGRRPTLDDLRRDDED